MEARKYRSLVMVLGHKAPQMEAIIKSDLNAKRHGKKWGHGSVSAKGAVHAFDEKGVRVCHIERDLDGLGVLVKHPTNPALVYEIPLAHIDYGIPELEGDERPPEPVKVAPVKAKAPVKTEPDEPPSPPPADTEPPAGGENAPAPKFTPGLGKRGGA